MTEANLYHPDFVNLCNLTKDEIDFVLKKNCPVFGTLVGDKYIWSNQRINAWFTSSLFRNLQTL